MEAGALVGKRVQSSVAESRKRYPQPHGKNKNTFAVRVKNEAEDVSLNVEELVCAVKLGCFLVDVRSPGEYAKGHVLVQPISRYLRNMNVQRWQQPDPSRARRWPWE